MTDPIVEEIKQKLNITDVIGHYITLRRAGTNFKGLCPFHNEKTPSFMVNPERQIFRCFGCGEAGDVLAFVMKQENIDFPNALRLLAGQAGVTLPEKITPTSHGPARSDLHAINAVAAQFFHQVLVSHPAGKEALTYLSKRGVTIESINRFQIGFAPANSQAIQALLTKHKWPQNLIQSAGSPDRFRDRIMFPFRDVIGSIVGFSGRALHDQMPKYLNTAETSLFRKNKYLYGLYEAKKAIGAEGKIIMVEGQLDLVMAHQAGTCFTVATSGTALTDDHLTVLRRYADTLYFAFDSDTAGKKATDRAIQLALNHGFDVSVIVLPDNSDPGEIITTQPEAWQKALAHPVPAVAWLFSYYFPNIGQKPSSTEREKIYTALFPYVERQTDPVSQSYALQRLALELGLSQDKAIVEAFETWKQKRSSSSAQPTSNEKVATSDEASISITPNEMRERERSLVGLLLINPSLLAYKDLHLNEKDFTIDALASLYTLIMDWYNKDTNKSSNQALIHNVEETLSSAGKQSLQKLLFDAQTNAADFTPEQFLQEYTFLVQSIRRRLKEARIQGFATRIAEAEAANDRQRVVELMKQMQTSLKQKELHAEENS